MTAESGAGQPGETSDRNVYQVSELVGLLRDLLGQSLPRIWVEGEISNFSKPASGHWYFTLKDARAQLRCAMFRNANFRARVRPQNGDAVMVAGRVDLYAARGELQMICEHLEPAGQGALLREFEALKQRLSAEGLFDPAHKRRPPSMPRNIGLITSATGAAAQDVLTALRRRFALAQVSFLPVPVQGEAAALAIVKALQTLPDQAPVDVILLVRGGGSLEDLCAFNQEAVARAVRACAVPVICGVGHETDFSIADFAADVRAPTPTAAAELVSPDAAQLQHRVQLAQNALRRLATEHRAVRAQSLDGLLGRLRRLHPSGVLRQKMQDVDRAEGDLAQAWTGGLQQRRLTLNALSQRLLSQAPQNRLTLAVARRKALSARLQQALRQGLDARRHALDRRAALLTAINPTAVLARGYAIARQGDQVLHSPEDLAEQAAFELQLARGKLTARRIS